VFYRRAGIRHTRYQDERQLFPLPLPPARLVLGVKVLLPHWLVLSRLAVPVARSALRPKRSMKPRSQSRNRNAEVVAKNWVSRRLSFELVRRLACAHASLKVDFKVPDCTTGQK
jgi:hypothetical protein